MILGEYPPPPGAATGSAFFQFLYVFNTISLNLRTVCLDKLGEEYCKVIKMAHICPHRDFALEHCQRTCGLCP